jgi:hypothetical protein
LDTGTSGTAFIQRQFCVDESIELKACQSWYDSYPR